MAGEYGVDQIRVLEGLEAVRVRPGMYIGSTGPKGLHHLVYEVVDNSIDEALAGFCKSIEASINEDGSVTVVDDGRGIPTDIHPQTGKSTLETVLTVLHAGGKFGDGGYQVSGGLHGVGISVVNALSSHVKVQVWRQGKLYQQQFSRGIPVGDIEVLANDEPKRTGTAVTFLPDTEIFINSIDFDYITLANRLRELAFLNAGLRIAFGDKRVGEGRDPRQDLYFYSGGIKEYIQYLNSEKQPLHDEIIYVQGEKNKVQVEVSLQWCVDAYSDNILGFANNIRTIDGGTHLEGLKAVLTRTMNSIARKRNKLKEADSNLGGENVREGLTAIVSVKVPNPEFEGQTKTKLGNTEVRGIVETIVGETLTEFLEFRPQIADAILEKAIQAFNAAEAARRARELVRRKSVLESSPLPGKLADCSSKDPSESEIFIVEGDSAGGCFDGDTLVALTDGRSLSFKELVAEQGQGKQNFCYTIRKNGKIGIERIINARVTKKNAEVVRVNLDNGETLVCTPDHLFMLRDGSYKPAATLNSNDSLMPLYRKLSDQREPRITIDGYEMVWDPSSESWLFTHLVADWHNRWQGVYQKEDGVHCHHFDFNKRNNNPTNLQRLSAEDHLAWHRQHEKTTSFFANNPALWKAQSEQARQQWQDEELLSWRSETTKQQWTPEFRVKRQQALQATYYRKTISTLKQIEIDKGFLDLDRYLQHRLETKDKSLLRFDTFCDRYFDGDVEQAKEAVANYNHRVLSVEQLSNKIDVYDIEVPHSHNFALASGVFVHNSAKQGRDRRTQAILPLRGKILNIEKTDDSKIYKNNEVQSLIAALGLGVRGEDFKPEQLRYHRICLMTDADVDGAHIRTLLLTFFYRYQRDLIDKGYVYVACPPLYKLERGKNHNYCYNEQELQSRIAEMPANANYTIQRFKGLGEMMPKQLWDTTMNPETRTLKRIEIEDAAEADRIFTILMGDRVAPRREFIETYGSKLDMTDLDI